MMRLTRSPIGHGPGPHVLSLALAAALALGCDATSEPAGDGQGLNGREFLLDSAEGFTAAPGSTVRVDFEDDDAEGPRFGFYADCNHHSGPYVLREGRLMLTGLGSTEIGCGEPLASQDDFLSDFFTGGPMVELDGDRLTFTGESATLVFLDREVADPDRPLTGRRWVVDTFLTADAASNLPLPQAPTLEFGDDGTLSVFSGCNTGGGEFVHSGSRLTLNGMAYTEEGCTEPGVADAEQHVQAVLSDGEIDVEIDAARLTLMRGDLGLGATSD